MTALTVARRVATPIVFGALLLIGWQLIVTVNDIPGYLLPAPSAIWEQVRENFADMFTAARASGLNALIGLLAGIVLALLAAVVGVWVPLLQRLLTPLASAVSAMPIVALAPVLSIMFSATSDLPRRIVVAIVAFFPVFVTTVRGLTRIDPVHAELMRSYAAGSWATTRVVRLPGAVPYLFTGVRVASSLAVNKADFAIAWVPKALASREQGAGITDVAQVYQRSGTLQVSFKGENITDAAALKGKKVGNWGFGNEFELFAGMTKAGLTPGKDNKLVQQQFDMQALLKGDIDAAQAMVYNEYAQVLEAKNPKTGKLYQPSDFNTISWQQQGDGMLQDAIWANTEKLSSDKTYQDTTVKFIQASLKGWAYCRDNVEKCRDIVVAKGSKLGASHQLWQMNEVNKLIWPAPAGAGMIDTAAWDQTVKIAEGTKNAEGKTVLTKAPTGEAYTNEYVTKALATLKAEGVDTTGANYKPETVTLEAGGK